MFSAVVSKCYPLTGNYKIIMEDAESDEEFDALPVLPFKGVDGASSVRYVYEVGTNVLVTQLDTGKYCILGCLPTSSTRVDKSGTSKVIGTGYSLNSKVSDTAKLIDSTVYSDMGGANYNGFEELDLIPGDISIKAPGGSSVSALRGGVVALDTETSSIKVNGPNSSIDTESFRYSNKTAMGSFSVTDKPDGSFSMEFLGNCDPAATSPNIQFRIDAEGASPSMSLSIGDFGIDIKSDGAVTVRCTSFMVDDGKIRELGSPQADDILQVDTGINEVRINTDSRYESVIKGNRDLSTGGELSDTVGSVRNTVTLGPDPTRNPLVAAAPDSVFTDLETVVHGSKKVSIGSTGLGGGSFAVESKGGDIRLESKTAVSALGTGSIAASAPPGFSRNTGAYGITLDARKVLLGGGLGLSPSGVPSYPKIKPPIPGGANPTLSGACKFNALFTYLRALHTLLDTHVHAVPPLTVPSLVVQGQSTAPGVTATGTTAPTPMFTAPLTPLALAVESSSTWILDL